MRRSGLAASRRPAAGRNTLRGAAIVAGRIPLLHGLGRRGRTTPHRLCWSGVGRRPTTAVSGRFGLWVGSANHKSYCGDNDAPYHWPRLTVGGRPVGGLDRWRLAWRSWFRRAIISRGLDCSCKSGPCINSPPEQATSLGDDVPRGKWSLCPRGEWRHPLQSWVIEIDNQSSVSPLAGWPDTYSAGVVDCLVALRIEREIDHARRAEAR